MAVELGLVNLPNSPKPIFRLAFENDLIDGPVSRWLNYANAQTDTSHDYDSGKAMDCLLIIPEFIKDASRLSSTMTGSTWTQ